MNIEKFKIQVSDINVEIVKKDIKNIHLAVYPPKGRVRLSSPKSMSTESLRLFLISKLGWIKKYVKKMNTQVRMPEREYIQGESHWVMGQRYLLNIIEQEAPPKINIRNKKYLDLYVRPGSEKAKREEVMKEWYREILKEQIPPFIEKWEKELNVDVLDWGVKKMKTKWGSCNIEAKRIWLNLELAKKPPVLLEYVVLHEVAHLLERTHNERYKSILNNHMPSWKKRQEQLNEVVF